MEAFAWFDPTYILKIIIMLTLNLAKPLESFFEYTIQEFPDGQKNIVIKPDNLKICAAQDHVVQISSRMKNFEHVGMIICAVSSLRNLGIKRISLYVPYFLGSRSDRLFEEGGNNFLKQVICPIINSLNFESVTVLDPHSDVLEACLNNFKKQDNFKFVDTVLNNMYPDNTKRMYLHSNCVIVAPDTGATKKIYKLAEKLNFTGDIITCIKDRDVNGKIKRFDVVGGHLPENKDIIIIDDICDGGRTFIETVEHIKEYLGDTRKGKIYLVVTHGIFSNGFAELSKYFDGIYCTNSYSELPMWQSDGGKIITCNVDDSYVTQINVF